MTTTALQNMSAVRAVTPQLPTAKTEQAQMQAPAISFSETLTMETKSLARSLYDSVSHLDSPAAKRRALADLLRENRWPAGSPEGKAFSDINRMLSKEIALEGHILGVTSADAARADALQELPSARGERLAFLQMEISGQAAYAKEMREQAALLKIELEQILANL